MIFQRLLSKLRQEHNILGIFLSAMDCSVVCPSVQVTTKQFWWYQEANIAFVVMFLRSMLLFLQDFSILCVTDC